MQAREDGLPVASGSWTLSSCHRPRLEQMVASARVELRSIPPADRG